MLKKLLSQTVIYGAGHILAKLLNVLMTPLLTDISGLETSDYGAFSEFYAYVSFINVVLIFGMETTFFRFVQDSKEPQKLYSQAFLWVMGMASVFLLVMLPSSDGIAAYMGNEGKGPWLMLLSGVIFLDVMAAMPLARLRHQEKAGRYALILIINVVITLALNFIFLIVLDWTDLTWVFVANLVASGVKFLLASWGNLPSHGKPDTKILRPMLGYAFFIMIAGFAGIMNETLDRALLPRLWPEGGLWNGRPLSGIEMNGIYAANYKVAMLIQLAIQAFRYAAEPFFFKQSTRKDSPETFARVFHFFLIAALMGFLVIGSFTRELVTFKWFGLFTFIGEAYWEGLSVVPILLMAYVFAGAYLNLSIWFKITKQVRFAILFTGAGALVTILGNVLFIPEHGYLASAWSTLACYVLMCGLVYLVGQRYYPVPYRLGRVSLYLALYLGLYLVNRSIGPAAGYWLAFLLKAVICLAGIGVVVLGERYFSPFRKSMPE